MSNTPAILPAPTAEQFRAAMANLAAGVAIVTSDGPAGLAGCTVSAVSSISDQPPTLLVCLNRASRNNAAIRENGRVVVNLLGASHEEIAARFANGRLSVEQRFADGEWLSEPGGVPRLSSALASLDCEILDVHEVGSHSVFFLTVSDIALLDAGDGLAYFARRFHALPTTRGEG